MASAERILIVEDEQHIAEGLRFNLEAEGYQVHTVDTGEAALELLAPKAPTAFDMMILDVMLPAKDGFTVVSELRQAGQFIPTLLLTARGRGGAHIEGERLVVPEVTADEGAAAVQAAGGGLLVFVHAASRGYIRRDSSDFRLPHPGCPHGAGGGPISCAWRGSS